MSGLWSARYQCWTRAGHLANARARFFEDYRDLLLSCGGGCVPFPPVCIHVRTDLSSGGSSCLGWEADCYPFISEAESLYWLRSPTVFCKSVILSAQPNNNFQELSKCWKQKNCWLLEAHRMSPYSQRASDVSVSWLMIHDIDCCWNYFCTID